MRVDEPSGVSPGAVAIALAEYDIGLLKRCFRQLMPDKHPIASRIGYKEFVLMQKNTPRREERGAFRPFEGQLWQNIGLHRVVRTGRRTFFQGNMEDFVFHN